MTRAEIDLALSQIFADLFDASPDEFSYETSPDTLLEWDSMAHIQLMAALEERFKLVLSPEDQVEMFNFELVGDVLAEHVAA